MEASVFEGLLHLNGDYLEELIPSDVERLQFPEPPNTWSQEENTEYKQFTDHVWEACRSKSLVALSKALTVICKNLQRPRELVPVSIVWIQLAQFRFIVDRMLDDTSLDCAIQHIVKHIELSPLVCANLVWATGVPGNDIPPGYRRKWFCSHVVLVPKK